MAKEIDEFTHKCEFLHAQTLDEEVSGQLCNISSANACHNQLESRNICVFQFYDCHVQTETEI